MIAAGPPDSPSSAETRAGAGRRKLRAARLSVGANGALVLAKAVVGLWSGSIAVLSDAVHSAMDLTASAVTLLSVRAAEAPPDEQHPYGHGKMESMAALVEAALIAIAAAFVVYEALERLRGHPLLRAPLNPTPGLALMALSGVTSAALSRRLSVIARATESPALAADARHMRADLVASVGVFAGLGLVRITGLPWFDAAAALGVAAFITPSVFVLTRDAYALLVDTRLPAPEEGLITRILEGDERVLGYHKLRTRRAGSERHVDVHVLIPDDLSLVDAHQVSEELEDSIREVLPSVSVNIHVEPYESEIRHQRSEHGVHPARRGDKRLTDAGAGRRTGNRAGAVGAPDIPEGAHRHERAADDASSSAPDKTG